MRKLFLLTPVSALLFLLPAVFDQETCLYVHANNQAKSVKCVDLADFFYEIILSVSSFPQQGKCNDREEAEIAALLQKSIDSELNKTPGTIKTRNKICSNAVNTRRLQQQTLPDSTSKKVESSKSLIRSKKQNKKRFLADTRKGSRSFIYVGGGRCRFCFFDNHDQRDLFVIEEGEEQVTIPAERVFSIEEGGNEQGTAGVVPSIDLEDDNYGVEALNIPPSEFKEENVIYSENAADANLCTTRTNEQFFNDFFPRGTYDKRWKNGRAIDLGYKSAFYSILGPYLPGETFGITISEIDNQDEEDKETMGPVTGARIGFGFWEIDIPSKQSPKKFWGDDPLYLYINGIKIDLGLLMTTPNARSQADANFNLDGKTEPDLEQMRLMELVPVTGRKDAEYWFGRSFAGIGWSILERRVAKNYGFGPQVDRQYKVELRVPKIIFDHTNEMDIQFFIKPKAKAKRFGIDDFKIMVETPMGCNITGVEDSPFDEFKQVMERRLREQLGLDVAREFQSKVGHCLENRIPVVDIHLVEKEKWTQANPRCT